VTGHQFQRRAGVIKKSAVDFAGADNGNIDAG
jgi:hypothetical protein